MADEEMPDRGPHEDDDDSHDLSHGETKQSEDHIMADDSNKTDKDGGGGGGGGGDREEDEDDDEDDEDEEDDEEEEEDLSEAPPPPPPPPPVRRRPKDPRSRKRRRRDRMFQDCVTIQIPIDCTADLGLAMRRTRRKRIDALAKAFPELVVTERPASTTTDAAAATAAGPLDSKIKGDNTMDVDDEDNNTADGSSKRKAGGKKDAESSSPRKILLNVPRREDYANVVDYLEAKYAQGVMLDDDEDDEDDPEDGGASSSRGNKKGGDDDDEGQGSVYSQSSFLDDRDLQRDVAEQVLANSTTTKLELQNNFDDAFFVNVGTLEVEESFLTEQGYDPVDDVENIKKPKRKRKPAEPKDKEEKKEPPKVKEAQKAENGEAKKKKAATAALATSKSLPKKKADAESPKKKLKPATKLPSAKKKEKPKAKMTEAEKLANQKKKEVDASYKVVVDLIKDMSPEDLPRRKTKEKVAITCPPDKKPGDSILFANPHVPGQRLKVKIPKNTKPGATFRVTVPVAPNPEDDEDNTDHNKWSRDFYDAYGDFCSLYDDWVDLMAVVKKEAGEKDFVVYFEKRQKFEHLMNDSPPDLKTPLDRNYMQKLLRRARQNRHKRERTLKRQEERAKELKPGQDGEQEDDDDDDDDDDEDGSDDDGKSAATDAKSAASSAKHKAKVKEKIKETANDAPALEKEDEDDDADESSNTVLVPELSTEFPTILFDAAKF